MNLPFTVEQFFEVFARYNDGVWPAQWLLTALALVVVVLIVQGKASHGLWIAAALSALWSWMALAYHFAYFTAIFDQRALQPLQHFNTPWPDIGFLHGLIPINQPYFLIGIEQNILCIQVSVPGAYLVKGCNCFAQQCPRCRFGLLMHAIQKTSYIRNSFNQNGGTIKQTASRIHGCNRFGDG